MKVLKGTEETTTDRCMMLFVQAVKSHARSLLNHRKEDQYIVESVINQEKDINLVSIYHILLFLSTFYFF